MSQQTPHRPHRSHGQSDPPDLGGKRALVVGLGRFGGGVGVTRWLVHKGASVVVTDNAPAESLSDSIQELADLDVVFHLGGHNTDDLDDIDLAILNPAIIKTRSEFVQEIMKRDIPWSTEMNLFCQQCKASIIAITGSYGKSTTCAMLNHVLRSCRDQGTANYTGVHLGGNIGRSLLMDLPKIKPTDLVVLEMSNAQLEDIPRINWSPDLAVMVNVWPHHLDRYDGFESYIQAKLNILGSHSTVNATQLIVGDCDQDAEALIADRVKQWSIPTVKYKQADPPVQLQISGTHNQHNANCVLSIAQVLNLDKAMVRESLQTFRGLPHRMEFVQQIKGVDYINDSKSTSPAAILSALHCLQKPLVVIIGGQHKQQVSFAECARELIRSCRAIICTGQTGTPWLRDLQGAIKDFSESASYEAIPPAIHQADDLEEALRRAKKEARTGDVVLYSPGAPSFDAYHNFAQRGEHFARLVTL